MYRLLAFNEPLFLPPPPIQTDVFEASPAFANHGENPSASLMERSLWASKLCHTSRLGRKLKSDQGCPFSGPGPARPFGRPDPTDNPSRLTLRACGFDVGICTDRPDFLRCAKGWLYAFGLHDAAPDEANPCPQPGPASVSWQYGEGSRHGGCPARYCIYSRLPDWLFGGRTALEAMCLRSSGSGCHPGWQFADRSVSATEIATEANPSDNRGEAATGRFRQLGWTAANV